MNEWLPIRDAASRLGISERTIRRRMSDGIIQSKMEDGRRLIYVDPSDVGIDESDDDTDTSDAYIHQLLDEKDAMIEQLRSEIEHLRLTSTETQRQLSEAQRQLSDAQGQLDEANARSDTIILQLTQQLDRANLQLEDKRQQRTLWQRVRILFAPAKS